MATGIIPARFGSTRLSGKALRTVAGKTIIQHVVLNARRARRLDRIIVATDDDRIFASVREIGADAVMTAATHPSGTDRIAEAARMITDDILVNIQGDEPEIAPETIDAVAALLIDDPELDMSTAAAPITSVEEYRSPSRVKVVMDERGRALYFSRSPIPYLRADPGEPPIEARLAEGVLWGHLGIYGYRRDALFRLTARPPAALERWEKLEQLRALDAFMKIGVVRTAASPPGIDTPEDLEAFRARCERNNSGSNQHRS